MSELRKVYDETLNALRVSASSAAPSGSAGGDLSGTYPNPTVAKLNNVAAANYYVSAGTDVAIADGGTGGSTAQAARDNLGIPSRGYLSVLTSETTTSTTYTDLATSGPSVTITIPASGAAKLIVTSFMSNNGATGGCRTGVVTSGATTATASTNETAGLVAVYSPFVAGASSQSSLTWVLTGLTPGSTTFKLQYRATVNGTATFANRFLIVETLP